MRVVKPLRKRNSAWSEAPGLYTNPTFNFTVLNDTVFKYKGEEYLNFTTAVVYAENGYGGLYMKPAHSGIMTLLEPGERVVLNNTFGR